nr:type II restriction endonuclease [Klebsiella pneumoniae]
AMREGLLALNARYRDLLSNDLGALAGFLFDVGSGRYPAPPPDGDALSRQGWEERLAQARAEAVKFEKASAQQRETDRTHTEIQAWLRDL